MSGELLEVELKFLATDDVPLHALAEAADLGAARLGPPRTVTELDRYLDTTDGRLAAARWACRLRTRSGATILSLKGPARRLPDDGLHRRPELEGPAGPDPDPTHWPDSPARTRLLQLAGGRPLIERLALRQVRTERSVAVDGRSVGTLSLDSCTVHAGGLDRGELWVVELELSGSPSERVVAALAAALAGVPGLHPDPASKLERALAMIEPEPR